MTVDEALADGERWAIGSTAHVLAVEVRRLREYVAEIDDEAVEAVGTPSEYTNGELQWHGRYTQLWRLIARMKRAEADLAALRQRHAEAVEAAFREGCFYHLYQGHPAEAKWATNIKAAWLASEARKGVTE